MIGLAIATLGGLAGCTQRPAGPSCAVTLDDHREPAWVSLDGQAPDRVAVAGAVHPISGTVRKLPDGTVFHPDFPFTPGLSYTAEGGGCTAVFTVPTVPATTPRVVHIRPSADAIPENVLRFYVTFSEPMAEGSFLDHVRLERVGTHTDLTGVFFDNIHELWSADRRRITLLVDPGRVKTGLVAHNTLGRAFEAGGRYRLHVLPTWTSLRGARLDAEHAHDFRAIAEDRRPVDPSAWTLELPAANTRDPLHIDFHEPVDHVSVYRLIRILAPSGEQLPGDWQLGAGERTAQWKPDRPWGDPVREYALHVSGRFEDIAGNNLNAAMDHQVGERRAGDEGQAVRRRLGSTAVTRP